MNTYWVTGKFEQRGESSYYSHYKDFSIIIDVDEVNADNILKSVRTNLRTNKERYIKLVNITNIVKL